ncbi:Uncharacterized protein Fot_37277 [Forsythia ovata]|uniref:Uncharacterized protein n=1 Tax=Forsythia ovata TaxID=205694 RepID=A0ABD1RYI9_9LAMI
MKVEIHVTEKRMETTRAVKEMNPEELGRLWNRVQLDDHDCTILNLKPSSYEEGIEAKGSHNLFFFFHSESKEDRQRDFSSSTGSRVTLPDAALLWSISSLSSGQATSRIHPSTTTPCGLHIPRLTLLQFITNCSP